MGVGWRIVVRLEHGEHTQKVLMELTEWVGYFQWEKCAILLHDKVSIS